MSPEDIVGKELRGLYPGRGGGLTIESISWLTV